MAETYDVTLSILVIKTSNQEPVVDEQQFFTEQTFATLANIADEFYTLVTKLQKL